jgi:nicotinamidase-related amidase
VHRPGQINAFDNADFVDAVKKTGRKKLLIAGISTEVCVAFVALSAKSLGYEPYAVLDASGTWSKLVEDAAIARVVQAGVSLTNEIAERTGRNPILNGGFGKRRVRRRWLSALR